MSSVSTSTMRVAQEPVGSCRIKLRSGRVRMETKDVLTIDDKDADYILACQAEIDTDLEVEA